LGAVLVLYKLIGVKLDQPLPFINIKLQNQAYFPHIVSAILFAVLLYLFLEFKQSQEEAKESLLTYVRVAVTTLWAILAFWIILPELAKNTAYEGVSSYGTRRICLSFHAPRQKWE
jgi:Trk-type K+ transport system membrane component